MSATSMMNRHWPRVLHRFYQLDRVPTLSSIHVHPISTTAKLETKGREGINTQGPQGWPLYNKQVYPPTEPGEKPRPAFICHMKVNVKYSPLKLWYVACLVRGMQIDEAIRQVEYIKKKGANIVRETLIEARELAVQKHNVEFRSNLWVAESFTGKGIVIKGVRKHARGRIGAVHYRYAHYFVRLEEGSPPDHYYTPKPDGPQMLLDWIKERRELKIEGSY